MVKKFVLIGMLMIIFTNCYYRTAYGKRRYKIDFDKMKLIKNDSLYAVVDTTKLYKLGSVFSVLDNNYLDNFRYIYLKFYSHNKVGMFYFFDSNNPESLNPENADMGYFNYIEGNFTTQIYFENPQGSGYIKDKCIFTKQGVNKIQLKSSNYIDEYEIIDLRQEFLVYKPDW